MKPLRIACALDDPAERAAFSAAMLADRPDCAILFPSSLADVERIHASDGADVLITDFRFHGGALADWLTLWPFPAVIVSDHGDSLSRLASTIKDEAAVFIERREDGGHASRLPLLVHKVLNIRESVARQNAHLQITERQYLNLLQAIPDIVYFLDEEGRFIYLNEAARGLGVEPSRLIGKHFAELLAPDEAGRVSRQVVLEELAGQSTGDSGAPKLFDERRTGERMTRNLELKLRRPAGAEYEYGSVIAYGEVASTGYRFPEFEGRGTGTVGIIRDITARKLHERELERLLAARGVLLREIHHRVRNNLQLVSSLLDLQEHSIEGPAERKVFTQVQTQVQAMALVHDLLYRAETFESVDMVRLLERLAAHLVEVYEGEHRGIIVEVEAPGVELALDLAIPVSLLANELASNCLHHAFPDGGPGRVLLAMREEGADWILEVADDGVGLEAARSRGAGPGIGTELIGALASQLKGGLVLGPGRAAVAGTRAAGTRALLRFPRGPARDSAGEG